MEVNNLKITILPNQFLNDDGSFKIERAVKITNNLLDEESKKNNVYDNIHIQLKIENISKILAMVLISELKNKTDYKLLSVDKKSLLANIPNQIYQKWLQILSKELKQNQITSLNLLNQFTSIFTPITINYATTIKDLNSLVSKMEEYIITIERSDDFAEHLAYEMNNFINQLVDKNVFVSKCWLSKRKRNLTIFTSNNVKEQYKSNWISLNQFAKVHTIYPKEYKINSLNPEKYYVPSSFIEKDYLTNEWLEDLHKIGYLYPEARLVEAKQLVLTKKTTKNLITNSK